MGTFNYSDAFRTILKKAVDADKTKDITLVYDEFFLKYFDHFSRVVNDLLLKVTYIFVPDSYQQVLQNNDYFYEDGEIYLPKGINVAINNSDIVLNFLTGSSKSSKVRGAVLNYIKSSGCKVVHCPKLNDEVLKVVDATNFESVHKHCELMAWALGNAHTATIVTVNPEGKELELNMRMGIWDNDPFISSGVIMENSWGNVPPGEAFCCPKLVNVNGSICINGSIPGYAFQKDEFLCLTFTKGKITDSYSSPNPEIAGYLKKLEENATRLKDGNWNMFAELGIGLNPAIKFLTGNPLFDEKMAGTLHIAIGDNFVFGHPNQSHIHEDLIVRKPTFILDGKKIIDKGKLEVNLIKEWRRQFSPTASGNLENCTIVFKQAKIHFSESGVKRKLNKGNRIGYIEIFTASQNKLIAGLNRNIHLDELFDIRYTELIRRAKKYVTPSQLNVMIETFIHYKMAVLKAIQ
jgi:hypothetical protein